MGFAGRPASHSTSASPLSRLKSGIGAISATRSGGVRVHRRKSHKKMHGAPRRSRLETEMMRDMMETNRAMRYAMIANVTGGRR